jgi:hypothetical protein
MMLLVSRARVLLQAILLLVAAPLSAQQLIGYVNTRDANVVGASDEMDGHLVLAGSVSVTAKDHTAPITLSRGGTVSVCQTSVLHLTESRGVTVAPPILLSLDRGAVEIQMNATASDSVMTPDLRFTVRNSGQLDLRVRVARNGDTCVENRGAGAPTLAVSDPFGESMYEVPAGRHVLFEHGSLHEVVDHETTPCGCPDEKGMSLADAMLNAPVKTPAPKPAPSAAPAQPTIVAPPLEKLPAPAAAAVVPPPAAHAPVVTPTPPPAAPAPKPVVAQTPAPVAAPPAIVTAAATVPKPAPPVPAVVAPIAVTSPAPVQKAATPVAAPPVEQAPAAPTEESVEQAAAIAAAKAAALHPFPAAISEGLAPVPESAPIPAGAPHPQISDTISYTAPATLPAKEQPASDAKSSTASGKPSAGDASAPPAPPSHDIAYFIGRFFRALFGRH